MKTISGICILALSVSACSPSLTIAPMPLTSVTEAAQFKTDCDFREFYDMPGNDAGVDRHIASHTVFFQTKMINGVKAYCGPSSFDTPLGTVFEEHCVAVTNGKMTPFPNSKFSVRSNCEAVAGNISPSINVAQTISRQRKGIDDMQWDAIKNSVVGQVVGTTAEIAGVVALIAVDVAVDAAIIELTGQAPSSLSLHHHSDGYYAGGVGSSHIGGHYVNPTTGNHYVHHH